jgi:hypothetical protein
MFEKVRTLWACKVGTWFALDFEAWDRDHSLLTEFGWSATRWEDGRKISELGHIIVKERRGYTSTYVRQWRDVREDFNSLQSFLLMLHFRTIILGKVKMLTNSCLKRESRNFWQTIVPKDPCSLYSTTAARISSMEPFIFLFSLADQSQSLRYLTSKGVEAPLDDISYALPDKTPKSGLFVVDTAEMFAALEGEGTSRRQSLQTVCRHLCISTSFLHNAGNDAHVRVHFSQCFLLHVNSPTSSTQCWF